MINVIYFRKYVPRVIIFLTYFEKIISGILAWKRRKFEALPDYLKESTPTLAPELNPFPAKWFYDHSHTKIHAMYPLIPLLKLSKQFLHLPPRPDMLYRIPCSEEMLLRSVTTNTIMIPSHNLWKNMLSGKDKPPHNWQGVAKNRDIDILTWLTKWLSIIQ